MKILAKERKEMREIFLRETKRLEKEDRKLQEKNDQLQRQNDEQKKEMEKQSLHLEMQTTFVSFWCEIVFFLRCIFYVKVRIFNNKMKWKLIGHVLTH